MRYNLWVSAGIVLALVGGALGYKQQWSRADKGAGKRTERTSNARAAVPVAVAGVMGKEVSIELRAIGAVQPLSTVSIRAQVTGTLTEIHFKEGQDVKKGDILFTIDSRPLEAALKQAEANLAKDMAQLENARQDARRYAELIKKQMVAQQQYDQIRTNAQALEAVVNADRAALENARVQLGYCTIRSPLDGRVGSYLVNEGNLVRANDSNAMVVINQINPIYVGFSVPQQHLTEIKKRMAGGELKVRAILVEEGSPFEQGKLTFVDNAVDRSTGTIQLKGTFANQDRRLWPGQFVNVVLILGTRENVLVIPSQAVQSGQGVQYVYVVKPDRSVEYRVVSVGMSQNGESVIEKGLRRGEKVVTDGQLRLAPGVMVTVKQEEAS